MMTRSKSIFNIFTLFALLASLTGSAVFVTPAYAAGIVVNSNADTVADDGTCTLREAITNANEDSQLYASAGECAIGIGTDTITFDADYTITLDGSQLPAVNSTIIINGNGKTSTIIEASTCNPVTLPSGCTPASYRVFEVDNAGDLTLDKLTVRHGQCLASCTKRGTFGGGIYNSGALNVSNSTIVINNALTGGGGIYNDGTLTVTNSTLSSNTANNYGGGIYSFNLSSQASLTVDNSTFSENSATVGEGGGIFSGGSLTTTNSAFSINFALTGGGIYNADILTITNNIFSGNSAYIKGGAINNDGDLTVMGSSFIENSTSYGDGGGIANSGTINISNSLFSNNSNRNDGGGIANFGILTITNSTFSDNNVLGNGGGIANKSASEIINSTFSNNSAYTGGGGIYNDRGNLTVANSTIAANSAVNSGGGNIYNNMGLTKLENTIIIDAIFGGDCAGTITADNYNMATDNTCGGATQKTSAEINLGLLADNGGSTQTMALLSGSAAIDAGDNSACPATDQRGTSRPQGNACDVGAFESSESAGTPTFADVPSSHWAYSYIERLYNAGITGGCGTSPLIYCPDATVTRAQMAIFILRGIHGSAYTPPAATGTVFTDVPLGSFAADWIEQLALEGVTSGCGGGNYCPDSTVTRAQMSIFLLRGEHGNTYTPPTATGAVFGDVPLGSFAVDWIEQLALEAITSGCGGGNYCPNNSVTRAEMAVFLVRAFSLP